MERGQTLSLDDLMPTPIIPAVVGGNGGGADLENILKVLEKVEKLLGNPVIQQVLVGILGGNQAPKAAIDRVDKMPAVEIVEKVVEKAPAGSIIPSSPTHAKLIHVFNKLPEAAIQSMIQQMGGEEAIMNFVGGLTSEESTDGKS